MGADCDIDICLRCMLSINLYADFYDSASPSIPPLLCSFTLTVSLSHSISPSLWQSLSPLFAYLSIFFLRVLTDLSLFVFLASPLHRQRGYRMDGEHFGAT